MAYDPDGTHTSGDEIVAGAHNYANQTTLIIGSKPEPADRKKDSDPYQFYGLPYHAILFVTPDGVVAQRPIEKTDGITGFGCVGGVGIRGLGAQNEGPHGPGTGAGTGGTGVMGHGGTGDLEINDDPQFSAINKTYDPGVGVIGIGGIWTGGRQAANPLENNRASRDDDKGGAGVIGIAGGENTYPIGPSFDQAKGVGVYGTSAVGTGVVAEATAVEQIGLIASGWWGIKTNGTLYGIQATAGATAVRATSTASKETFGIPSFGVDATGVDAGIRAVGRLNGPAGIFSVELLEKAPRAQLRIEPVAGQQTRVQTPFTPTPLEPTKVINLPKKGTAGEIFVSINVEPDDPHPPDQHATMWFCIVTGGNVGDQNQNAVWREVLLGPSIRGDR